MNQTHPKPAVSAVIVQENEVLLVKRGCEPNLGLWSFPGGSIELGETAREALAREVLEETSLEIAVGSTVDVSDIIARSGNCIVFHYVIISFVAEVVSGTPQAGSDAAEVRWVPVEEVPKLPTTHGLPDRLASALRVRSECPDD